MMRDTKKSLLDLYMVLIVAKILIRFPLINVNTVVII